MRRLRLRCVKCDNRSPFLFQSVRFFPGGAEQTAHDKIGKYLASALPSLLRDRQRRSRVTRNKATPNSGSSSQITTP